MVLLGLLRQHSLIGVEVSVNMYLERLLPPCHDLLLVPAPQHMLPPGAPSLGQTLVLPVLQGPIQAVGQTCSQTSNNNDQKTC
jgi:hypothetical protein